MYRQTAVKHWFMGQPYFTRIQRNMKGRLKNESSLAQQKMFVKLRRTTKFRTAGFGDYRKATLNAVRVNAAAAEQGTSVNALLVDLARQNIHLEFNMLIMVAQYEPLAFRSLCELASSAVKPPPLPRYTAVTPFHSEEGKQQMIMEEGGEEAQKGKPISPTCLAPAKLEAEGLDYGAQKELHDMLTRMLKRGMAHPNSPIAKKAQEEILTKEEEDEKITTINSKGGAAADLDWRNQWMDSWKEFEVIPVEKRIISGSAAK